MKIIIILLFTLLPFTLLGQDKKLTEVEILTENYERAVERTTKGLTDKYKDELKKLLKKYSDKGDVQEVRRITDLLTKFEEPKESQQGTILYKENLIVDSVWKNVYGSIFSFKKGGVGIKTSTAGVETAFIWRVLDDDIIEFTARMHVDSPLVTEYMRMDAIREAYVGKTKETINSKLTRIK